MSRINKKEFKKNVEFLRNNIPKDEIYEFAEQCLVAAEFFLFKWSQWVDLYEETEKDEIVHVWVSNVIHIRQLNEENYTGGINTKLRNEHEL